MNTVNLNFNKLRTNSNSWKTFLRTAQNWPCSLWFNYFEIANLFW